MDKRLLLYPLAFLFVSAFPASGADPSVSVVDRQDNKSSTSRSEIKRINFGSTSVEIIKKDGEKLVFDKATIARILLADDLSGIDDMLSTESSISVTPRVTQDIVNIAGADYDTPFYLFDINGQIRLTGKCHPDGTSLSLSTLGNGMYLLVVGENTFKIVKK